MFQQPPEDPACITQRLIDEELAKIEKEKAGELVAILVGSEPW